MKSRKSVTPGSSTAIAARNPTEKSPARVRRKTPRRPTNLLRAETIESSSLYNKDLAPVPGERRTWRTYNYAALWISMSVNIPTYMLASGMIAGGMYARHRIHPLPPRRLRPLLAPYRACSSSLGAQQSRRLRPYARYALEISNFRRILPLLHPFAHGRGRFLGHCLVEHSGFHALRSQ